MPRARHGLAPALRRGGEEEERRKTKGGEEGEDEDGGGGGGGGALRGMVGRMRMEGGRRNCHIMKNSKHKNVSKTFAKP